MISQSLTPQRTQENIEYSLKKIAVLAELIRYEHDQYLSTTRFKAPQANMFAKRIGSDCQAIKVAYRSFVCLKTDDYTHQYNGVMWRILDKLCELDLEVLEQHAEYLEEALVKIEG